MSVENAEVAAFGPTPLVVGFGNIHDDGHSVLIVIFYQPMKSVDCIAFESAIGTIDEFDRVYLRNVYQLLFLHS